MAGLQYHKCCVHIREVDGRERGEEGNIGGRVAGLNDLKTQVA